jgi:hypothetical protein
MSKQVENEKVAPGEGWLKKICEIKIAGWRCRQGIDLLMPGFFPGIWPATDGELQGQLIYQYHFRVSWSAP